MQGYSGRFWGCKKMIRLYHGTTTEAYCSILKNGFCHKDVVWTCSDFNMLYFYSDELIEKNLS